MCYFLGFFPSLQCAFSFVDSSVVFMVSAAGSKELRAVHWNVHSSPDALCLDGSQCHRLRKQRWFSFMNIEEESSSFVKWQRFWPVCLQCVCTHSVSICPVSEHPLVPYEDTFLETMLCWRHHDREETTEAFLMPLLCNMFRGRWEVETRLSERPDWRTQADWHGRAGRTAVNSWQRKYFLFLFYWGRVLQLTVNQSSAEMPLQIGRRHDEFWFSSFPVFRIIKHNFIEGIFFLP